MGFVVVDEVVFSFFEGFIFIWKRAGLDSPEGLVFEEKSTWIFSRNRPESKEVMN